MGRKGRKYRKVYHKMFISYITIFLLPVLAALLFYLYTYTTTKQQTDETNLKTVQTIKQGCDAEIGAYIIRATQIAFNKELQMLSVSEGEFEDSDFYNLYNLYEELNNIKVTCNSYNYYCQDIFVYFQKNQRVVSTMGNMKFSMYYDMYNRTQTMNEAQMQEYLSRAHYFDVIRLEPEKESGNSLLLVTLTNMKASLGLESSVVGILLNVKALNDNIESLKWDGGDVLVLDSSNQILNRKAEDTEYFTLQYEECIPEKDLSVQMGGEKYIVRTEESDVLDWKYVSLIPESVVSKPVKRIRNIFLLENLFCLIVGFVISWQMTKINYNPLENLLDMLHRHNTKNEEDFGDNEYLYLQKKTKALLEEHADFSHMVINNQKIIHQYYLTRLLEAFYDECDGIEEKDAKIAKLKDGMNMVLLIQADAQKKEEVGTQTDDKKDSLKKFIIENVLMEEIDGRFYTEIVDVGEMLVVIVHFQDEKAEKEQFMEALDNMQHFIQKNFSFRVIALAGTCHAGLEGIHLSYIEAREMEIFIQQLDSDYMSYEEIRDNSYSNYYYPAEIEAKIVSAMLSGNVPVAVSYIRSVIETNTHRNKMSPFRKCCLFYDILGTILKGAAELGVGNMDEYENLHQISSKISYVEMVEEFEKLIQSICEKNTENTEAGGVDSGTQLSTRVVEYIRENYQNPDLNISQTGLYFHMTPAYLSTLFKKQTGESLLKFISQVRVEAAKSLLEEGKSVSEVAEMVGFRDVSTFIRVFKKQTGLTPGQFSQNKN